MQQRFDNNHHTPRILGEYRAGEAMRLDLFLALQKEIKSRSSAKKAIESGLVTVNGKSALKTSMIISPGDNVIILVNPKPQAARMLAQESAIVLPVLYEDDQCIVIDKPAGIAVHPGSSMAEDELTIQTLLEIMFAERSIPFFPDELLAHRLDKDTTGCLLVAKNPAAHESLQNQFRDRTVDKQYLALVAGVPAHRHALIDSPVGRDASARTRMSVMRSVRGRHAKTEYRVLSAEDGAALLACDLYTGRTHQIRVHLSTIGHCILGDNKYFSPLSRELEKEHHIGSLCLHAWKLKFDSPEGGSRISVCSPVPPALISAIKSFSITVPDPGNGE